MESNGKALDTKGRPVDVGTAPVVFGDPGTRGQHAFYQALHQGRQLIACDFIAPLESRHQESRHATGTHHDHLLANFLAQTEALMKGRTELEAFAAMEDQGVPSGEMKGQLPHRIFEGNRPTNSIVADRFDAFALGQLIALYEHKVFVQAVVWGINPFDQWGVEWGKELAAQILTEMDPDSGDTASQEHCSSTLGLIARLNAHKAKSP
jgi:glucose-6-phosphate isomerase